MADEIAAVIEAASKPGLDELAEWVHEAMPDTRNWRDYFRRIDEPDGWWLEIRRDLSRHIAATILARLAGTTEPSDVRR